VAASVLAVLFALLWVPALPAFAADSERGWLRLLNPAEGETENSLPLLEVRGQAGARGLRGHDLVLLIDVSDSTTRASGLDLDADGPSGLTSPNRLRELGSNGASELLLKRLAAVDLEDSVLFAEVLAAEHLLARLPTAQVRIGIVSFSAVARVRAPLGTSRKGLERALDGMRRDFHMDLRGTDFGAAIDAAIAMLRPPPPMIDGVADPEPPEQEQRPASILLLSDGAPTLPVHGDRARLAALAAADRAFAEGIRIYSFALGNEPEGEAGAEDPLDVYAGIAARTGGRMERLARPADAIARLRQVDLADLAHVEMQNITMGTPARAVRTFPDGSFDGFVLLQEGVNRVRVDAIASDGRRATAERRVRYTPSLDTGGVEALLAELRRRTRETELWVELEHGRAEAVGVLELQVGEPVD